MQPPRSRTYWLHRIILILVSGLSVVILFSALGKYGGVDAGGVLGSIARMKYTPHVALAVMLIAALVTAYDMVATRARMRRREAEIDARLAPFRPEGQQGAPVPSQPVAGGWSWKKILVEAVGWYGAAGLLSAYLLSSFDILHPNQPLYQILNVTAALGIVIVSLSKKNYQPAVLDIIWATIGTISLVRMFVS